METTPLDRWLTGASATLLVVSAGLAGFGFRTGARVAFLLGVGGAIAALVLQFKPIYESWVARRHESAEEKARVRRLIDRTNDLAIRLRALANADDAWPALNEFLRELDQPLEDLVRGLSREGVDVAALGEAMRTLRAPDDLRQLADLLSDVTDALDA